MADRERVGTSLPCETPGCHGFLACHGGSKLKMFNGRLARFRYRKCEICESVVESIEFRNRVLKKGHPERVGVLPENESSRLFD